MVEEEAQKVVRMVENNDMKSLEKLLFETNELSEDEELSDFFETEDEETDDNGVIAKIVLFMRRRNRRLFTILYR